MHKDDDLLLYMIVGFGMLFLMIFLITTDLKPSSGPQFETVYEQIESERDAFP